MLYYTEDEVIEICKDKMEINFWDECYLLKEIFTDYGEFKYYNKIFKRSNFSMANEALEYAAKAYDIYQYMYNNSETFRAAFVKPNQSSMIDCINFIIKYRDSMELNNISLKIIKKINMNLKLGGKVDAIS